MSVEIKLNKKVYNKNNYSKVIDNKFTQLGVVSNQDQLTSQLNVNDLFDLYNELFYNIPEYGNTNSHEFLIKKSSEYIQFDQNNEEIIALQNEIAELRAQLLEEQKNNINSQTNL
jgi:hypothetical protein